jgi:7,8-dihydropterin-6-yl-methyl-4-(beta-D-ribofuranosyl)aminobenzene 5'-phosphate synthase
VSVRITTLSENGVAPRPRGLLGEWGLSVLVEVNGLKVLLDAGQSVSAVNNGDIMGVDWPGISAVVLSHGHYDHTGGLRRVLLRMRKTVPVIAHPDVWAPKYLRVTKEETPAYIGVPCQQAELERLGADFELTRDPAWLTDDVVASGEIPMVTDFETVDPGMYVKEEKALVPDPLADDQALFMKTERGLVVVLGCAHRGVINTLRHAQRVTGVETIHTVVGGTHLIRASEAQLEQTIAELTLLGVQRLGVSHCTGNAASVRLAQGFGGDFFFNNAGTQISL